MGTCCSGSRRSVTLLALGALAALAGGGQVASGAPEGAARTGQPKAGELTAKIATGHVVGPLAAGEGAVWVKGRDGVVVRIEPSSNTVTATIEGASPIPFGTTGWIAAGNGAVWTTNTVEDSVTRIDPATNAVVATIPVGEFPTGIALTPGAVWVANHHGRSLSRIDPTTNAVVATIPVGDATTPPERGPQELAAAGGSVWFKVLESSGGMVERLDPATNSVVAKIALDGPCSFGTDGSALWLGCLLHNELYQVDLATNALGPPAPTPLPAFGLGVGLGAVWSVTFDDAAYHGPRGLVRFDSATGATEGETAFAASGGLTVGYGAVWAGSEGGHVLRFEP